MTSGLCKPESVCPLRSLTCLPPVLATPANWLMLWEADRQRDVSSGYLESQQSMLYPFIVFSLSCSQPYHKPCICLAPNSEKMGINKWQRKIQSVAHSSPTDRIQRRYHWEGGDFTFCCTFIAYTVTFGRSLNLWKPRESENKNPGLPSTRGHYEKMKWCVWQHT